MALARRELKDPLLPEAVVIEKVQALRYCLDRFEVPMP